MNILVIMLAGIGDCMLQLPAVKALRAKFPDACITALVTYGAAAELCRRTPVIDEVIAFDFLQQGHWQSLRCLMKLRKQRFDCSLLMYPANRWQYNLITRLIGSPQRLSHIYDAKRLASLSFLQNMRIPTEFHRHTIDENLGLVKLLGASAGEGKGGRTIKIPLTPAENKRAEEIWKERGIKKVIGIHAGSSTRARMDRKRWPAENFSKVADALVKKTNTAVMLFGGPEEQALNERIKHLMKHPAMIAPPLSFFENAALIQRCSLFICNDTGLMHVAAAGNVPVVVIEGPTNPYKTWPQSSNASVMVAGLDCQPCYRIGEDIQCIARKGRFECLTAVTPAQVVTAAEKFLGKKD